MVNLTAFIEKTKKLWNEKDFQNIELWRSYREEFENYTKNDFNRINNQKIRELRDFLKQRGVWVEKEKTLITMTLYNVLQEGECTAWSKKKILKCDCEEHFTSPKIKWMLNEKKERAAQIAALKFRKFSSSARSEIPKLRLTPSKISKPSAAASAPLSARSEVSASQTALLKIPKPPAPASAPLAAPLATPRPISSEISLSSMQSSALQQTKQPTSSPPEKTGQNQPAPHQQSPMQQTSSQSTAASFKTPTSPQKAKPPIIFTPLQAAKLHDESFYIASGCISYKKRMN